jgi:hypothetical protein
MIHVICATVVFVLALAETTVRRQWTQQCDWVDTRQSAARAASQFSGQSRNWA